MANTQTMIGGLVFSILMFSFSGVVMSKAATQKADVNCDASCDDWTDLQVMFFFIGGMLGVGISMGVIPPPNQWGKKHHQG